MELLPDTILLKFTACPPASDWMVPALMSCAEATVLPDPVPTATVSLAMV